jgi:hypothetical protein
MMLETFQQTSQYQASRDWGKEISIGGWVTKGSMVDNVEAVALLDGREG